MPRFLASVANGVGMNPRWQMHQMTRKLWSSAFIACCVLLLAFLYSRYVRPRAHTYATLIFSTPHQDELGTCGIVPASEALAPGQKFTISTNNVTFGDGNHKLSATWTYCGGALSRDVYRFQITYDGTAQYKTIAFSNAPIVIFSQDDYTLTLHPDRECEYANPTDVASGN